MALLVLVLAGPRQLKWGRPLGAKPVTTLHGPRARTLASDSTKGSRALALGSAEKRVRRAGLRPSRHLPSWKSGPTSEAPRASGVRFLLRVAESAQQSGEEAVAGIGVA
jgi:hypothetical protein